MKSNYKIVFLILLVISFVKSNAQNYNQGSSLSHEVGFIIGSNHFSTDYGQRDIFKPNIANGGLGFGIVHYLAFTDYRYDWNQGGAFWSSHFKIRTEVSYYSAKLEHFGVYVDSESTTIEAQKLRAMHGKAQTLNAGIQLEFHIVNINDFGSGNTITKLSPYLSIGALTNFYKPTVSTDFGNGDWHNDPSLLFNKWAVPGAANDEKGQTYAITAGIGSRLKITQFSDVFFEMKMQYFLSDFVDGLNATRPEDNNLYNDWNVFLHVGYIYYL